MPRRTRPRHQPLSGCESLESRRLLSGSQQPESWTIRVTEGLDATDDVIVVDRDPVDSSRLRATVNGVIVGTRLEATVRQIRIFSGSGDDTVAVDIPGGSLIATFIEAGPGDDTVTGSDGDDTIAGGDGSDTISGGRGRDSISGGAGDDSISGGRGGDTISGGSGDDSIAGGDGSDSINGNGGRDTIRGGRGLNTLVGGAGHDTVFGVLGVDHATLDQGEHLIGNESTNPLREIDGLDSLRAWFIDTAMRQWGEHLGRAVRPWWQTDHFRGGGIAAMSNSAMTAAADHSGTNTQVAGVDEGDIVETDGRHLFVLAGDGVDILSTAPGDDLAFVAHVPIAGDESALLLDGTRLTVISSVYGSWSERIDVVGFGHAAPRTAVTVIDVAAPAEPRVVERTEIDGWCVATRAIGSRVIVVTQDGLDIPEPAFIDTPAGPFLPGLKVSGDDAQRPSLTAPMVVDAVAPSTASFSRIGNGWWRSGTYEGEAAYRARLEAAWTAGVLPKFTVDGEPGGALAAAGRTYLPVDATSAELLSVATFEVGDEVVGPESLTTVAGVSGIVSASTSSLYIASSAWGSWWDPADERVTTNVYKFDLGDASVPLVAMGAVPGQVLDQFSLDEHEGLLRVATTRWTAGDGGSSSGVYVLRETAGNLAIVGMVDRLAPGERIYSARFVGARAYVSTFRQVDPFFVIDLAEPSAPRVEGELKVPGFSNFLQPLDETHVLGIGRDADPETGRALGVQVSLFDVSEPSAPVRTAVHTFPGNGWSSWSEALWDHHAVSWFARQGILTLPVQHYDGGGEVNSLVVLEVDRGADAGFTVLGEIAHDTALRRSVRIGEFLCSVSWGEVQMHPLTDPTVVLARRRLDDRAGAPIAIDPFPGWVA